MSTNRRFGLLPFYGINQPRDWELKGYYNNWQLALKFVPRDTLVSFRTPLINGSYTAPSTMILRKLSILGETISIVSNQSVTSGLTKYTVGSQTYYYRQQGAYTSDVLEYLENGCIYDIYIIDSNDNEFVSDIFVAIEETELYLYTEDNQYLLTEDGQKIVFQ